MSKTQYPPPQIVPVQTNATTASPNVVKAITLDPAYEMKTVQVVLTRDQGTLKTSLYRASTSPGGVGYYSREDYARAPTGRFEKTDKAEEKFVRPEIPAAAKLTALDGLALYTMHDMTPEEIEALRADLPELRRR